MRRSNNILIIGVAVFAVGALLAFFGLKSQSKPVAKPQSARHLEFSAPFLMSRPTIDPGPSGEDPDIGSGNLAMSDHRVRAGALGPVMSRAWLKALLRQTG